MNEDRRFKAEAANWMPYTYDSSANIFVRGEEGGGRERGRRGGGGGGGRGVFINFKK
jgi:hypothetical protein